MLLCFGCQLIFRNVHDNMHHQGLVEKGEHVVCVWENLPLLDFPWNKEMMRTYADADSFVHYLGVLFAAFLCIPLISLHYFPGKEHRGASWHVITPAWLQTPGAMFDIRQGLSD